MLLSRQWWTMIGEGRCRMKPTERVEPCYRIDPDNTLHSIDGKSVSLSEKEAALFAVLDEHQRRQLGERTIRLLLDKKGISLPQGPLLARILASVKRKLRKVGMDSWLSDTSDDPQSLYPRALYCWTPLMVSVEVYRPAGAQNKLQFVRRRRGGRGQPMNTRYGKSP